MKWLFPHPVLSAGVFGASILLSSSVQPPSLALAALMALGAPQVMRTLGIAPVRIRRPLTILRLAWMVALDILRSNVRVARILLGHRVSERVAGFVQIPLELRDRYALAVLAIIITSTPGTLWIEYDRLNGRLLIHVLDLVDEAEWIQSIKTRYERPLMEIFE